MTSAMVRVLPDDLGDLVSLVFLSADFFGVPEAPFFFPPAPPFLATGAFGFCLRYSRRAAVGTLLRLLWTRFSRGWSLTIEFTVFLVLGTLSGVLSFFGVPFAIY